MKYGSAGLIIVVVIGGMLIGNMIKTNSIISEFHEFQEVMNTTTPRNTDVDKALQDIAENTQGLVDVLRIIASKELEIDLVVKSSSGT